MRKSLLVNKSAPLARPLASIEPHPASSPPSLATNQTISTTALLDLAALAEHRLEREEKEIKNLSTTTNANELFDVKNGGNRAEDATKPENQVLTTTIETTRVQSKLEADNKESTKQKKGLKGKATAKGAKSTTKKAKRKAVEKEKPESPKRKKPKFLNADQIVKEIELNFDPDRAFGKDWRDQVAEHIAKQLPPQRPNGRPRVAQQEAENLNPIGPDSKGDDAVRLLSTTNDNGKNAYKPVQSKTIESSTTTVTKSTLATLTDYKAGENDEDSEEEEEELAGNISTTSKPRKPSVLHWRNELGETSNGVLYLKLRARRLNGDPRRNRKNIKKGVFAVRAGLPWTLEEEALLVYYRGVLNLKFWIIADALKRTEMEVIHFFRSKRPMWKREEERKAIKKKISGVKPIKSPLDFFRQERDSKAWKSEWRRLTVKARQEYIDKSNLDRKRFRSELTALGVSYEQILRYQQLTPNEQQPAFVFRGETIPDRPKEPFSGLRKKKKDEDDLDYALNVVMPREDEIREEEKRHLQIPLWLRIPYLVDPDDVKAARRTHPESILDPHSCDF